MRGARDWSNTPRRETPRPQFVTHRVDARTARSVQAARARCPRRSSFRGHALPVEPQPAGTPPALMTKTRRRRGSKRSAHMSRDSHLPTLFGRATLVSDGHTTLKDAARGLRDLCAREDGQSVAPDSELRSSFDGFAERILSHFSVEEGGSYFGTLAEDSPDLVGSDRALERRAPDDERGPSAARRVRRSEPSPWPLCRGAGAIPRPVRGARAAREQGASSGSSSRKRRERDDFQANGTALGTLDWWTGDVRTIIQERRRGRIRRPRHRRRHGRPDRRRAARAGRAARVLVLEAHDYAGRLRAHVPDGRVSGSARRCTTSSAAARASRSTICSSASDSHGHGALSSSRSRRLRSRRGRGRALSHSERASRSSATG